MKIKNIKLAHIKLIIISIILLLNLYNSWWCLFISTYSGFNRFVWGCIVVFLSVIAIWGIYDYEENN